MPDYGSGTTPSEEILLAGGNLEYCLTITGEISAGDFVSVGYTDKEVGGTLTVDPPTFKEVMATGLKDPVKRKATGRKVRFKTTLLQSTLANIAIAVGGAAADVVGGAYKGGASVDAPFLKWRYTVQDDSQSSKDKRLYLMKAKVVEAVEVPFKDDETTGLAVTIEAWEVLGTETTPPIRGGASLAGFRFVLEEAAF